ncbi:U6 snRNA-associated Sm-like protein LSm2 [Trapelia coarctata]|nr:U6 snRNA-associated Sm-like protein LSm2 [Trapelia coarctata]
MSDPIPVIVCGRQAVIATAVKNSLQPEYEVIHVVLVPATGASEIRLLLQGGAPSPIDPENIGTKNYSKPPAAVIIGSGYDDADFAELREACEGKSNVPWLRVDMSKPKPPLGPGFFKTLVDHEVTVELKNDIAIRGTLKSVDQFLNIKLDDIQVVEELKYPHLSSVKNVFIRGSVVRYVHLPGAAVDTALLEDATRREAAQQASKAR